MKLRYLTLTACLASLLASCISISQPPRQWAAAIEIPKNTCVNLAGTYTNKAIEAPDNQDRSLHEETDNPVLLSELFISYIPKKYFTKHSWADTVELDGIQQEQLKVILKRDGKTIFKKTLKKNEDFECSTDGLVISETRNENNILGLIDIKFKKIIITKSVDESILATLQVKEVADVFFIPGYAKVVQRYKFSLER